MSKKNFISGLDDLFASKAESEETDTKTVKKPKSSRKNFTSSLNALFEDALNESLDEHSGKMEKEKKLGKIKKPSKKPRMLSGLDSLIRRTVESAQVELPPSSKKRITFTFDKEKLDELKRIAKLEKAYIKDIIDEVLTEFISKKTSNND